MMPLPSPVAPPRWFRRDRRAGRATAARVGGTRFIDLHPRRPLAEDLLTRRAGTGEDGVLRRP